MVQSVGRRHGAQDQETVGQIVQRAAKAGDAEAIADGESVVFDLQHSLVRCVADAAGRDLAGRGPLLSCQPIPAFLIELVQAGGLLPQLKRRLQRTPG
jgi:3-isopropylmalate/(R)-2-methylmalate dehydratase small subunit